MGPNITIMDQGTDPQILQLTASQKEHVQFSRISRDHMPQRIPSFDPLCFLPQFAIFYFLKTFLIKLGENNFYFNIASRKNPA